MPALFCVVGRVLAPLVSTPAIQPYKQTKDHMPHTQERTGKLSERVMGELMGQIDSSQGIMHCTLHKHLAIAKGNDRSKQGIIVNTSNL